MNKGLWHGHLVFLANFTRQPLLRKGSPLRSWRVIRRGKNVGPQTMDDPNSMGSILREGLTQEEPSPGSFLTGPVNPTLNDFPIRRVARATRGQVAIAPANEYCWVLFYCARSTARTSASARGAGRTSARPTGAKRRWFGTEQANLSGLPTIRRRTHDARPATCCLAVTITWVATVNCARVVTGRTLRCTASATRGTGSWSPGSYGWCAFCPGYARWTSRPAGREELT